MRESPLATRKEGPAGFQEPKEGEGDRDEPGSLLDQGVEEGHESANSFRLAGFLPESGSDFRPLRVTGGAAGTPRGPTESLSFPCNLGGDRGEWPAETAPGLRGLREYLVITEIFLARRRKVVCIMRIH